MREQAEGQQRQAEEEREQARELTRETTFDEYIAACHSLLCEPLRVACPSRSTKGSIPAPTGKYCPTTFREWTDFDAQQSEIYNIVRSYLQPAEVDAPRLFPPLLALRDLGRRLCSRPLSSEKDLEGVERYGKDDHVRDIISALCQNPAAREELRLGSGFRFDSHANALEDEAAEDRERDTTSGRMQQSVIDEPENLLAAARPSLCLGSDGLQYTANTKSNGCWVWTLHAHTFSLDHNRVSHAVKGVSRQYLFARFAWDIFPRLRNFLSASVSR